MPELGISRNIVAILSEACRAVVCGVSHGRSENCRVSCSMGCFSVSTLVAAGTPLEGAVLDVIAPVGEEFGIKTMERT